MTAGDHSIALESIARDTGRSPLDVLEQFLERASIREYDGGMSRAEAESAAVGDVREWCAASASQQAADTPERAS